MSIGVSDAVVSNYDLAFSISPAKKNSEAKKSIDDDDEYTITLAPFTKAPEINFGTVKLNNQVERNLNIINPQEMPKIRKPLATLQPNNFKKQNSAHFNNATKSEQASTKKEAKVSLAYDKANKENEPAVSDLRRQTSIISIPRMYKNNPNDTSFKQSDSTSVFYKKANNETKYFDDDGNTFGPQIEEQRASLTPKLSDFLKPSSYFNLDSLLLSCEKMTEQFLSSTQKASTKPIGRTLDLSAVSSASATIAFTTVLNMSKTTLKNKQTCNQLNYDDPATKQAISITEYYESVNAMDVLVNAVVICQKVWRMKRCFMGLRKEDTTNRIYKFMRDINLDMERQRHAYNIL